MIEPAGVDLQVNYNYATDEVFVEILALTLLPGDADGDGDVDLDDFDIMAGHMYQPVAGGAGQGDFNGDGVVNLSDHAILALHFGQSLGETAANLPEPGTLTLALLGGLCALSRRRHI